MHWRCDVSSNEQDTRLEKARVGQIADAHDVIKRAFDRKPRIYCFINGGKGTDMVRAMAMAEDGTCLVQHLSSNDDFAQLDSGFAEAPALTLAPAAWGPNLVTRERFAEHYPDGYDLEWVDDPRSHAGLLAAYALNQEKAKVLAPVPGPWAKG
jgi:hypothetical protein